MLSAYCQNVLKTELQRADYTGLTAAAAWAWLTQPTPQSPVTRTAAMLTPGFVAGLLGPMKAEAVAAALKVAFPTIADHLLTAGVDPLNAASQAFLAQLVSGGALTTQDVAALLAASTATVTPPPRPPRLDTRFEPALWPHVAADGTPGAPADPAIHGFPNALDRADFDAAWSAAGRN